MEIAGLGIFWAKAIVPQIMFWNNSLPIRNYKCYKIQEVNMFNFRMMKKKEFKLIGLFLSSLIIFLCILACAKEDENGLPPKPPIEIPFEVHKAGAKVETEIRVVEHREYIFDLEFKFKENDSEDRARVKKLVGDDYQLKNGDPGIHIPLRFKITSINAAGETPIFEKEILDPQDLRLKSWGGNNFDKLIAYFVLKPGLYRVSLESLKDIPELIGTPVFLRITYMVKVTPIDNDK
jgi:hypothetical protein